MSAESHIIINDTISIPVSELDFRFSTSSGPGGQHANRAATRVTLLFDVSSSPSLDDETRAKLLEALAHRLDKAGVLRIQVQDTRSQRRNREIAQSRFMILLTEALAEPKERIETKPPRAAGEKRLEEKKKRGQLKRERSKDWLKDAY